MARLNDNMLAALVMSASMAAFTINDAFMKQLIGPVPLMQAIFLRGLLTVAMTLVVVTRLLGPVRLDLPGRDWAMIALRSLAEVGAAMSIVAAITMMPLANATAILQTVPLSIAIAGAAVFRDPLGWRRLTAIMVGFAGVLLIVKPGTTGFDTGAVWAVAGMACVTIRDLAVRGMSRSVPTATVTVTATLSITVSAGAASLWADWQPMGVREWALLCGTSIFVIVGYVTSIIVMRVGDISFAAPFRYTALVWALLLGLFVFGEWPDGWALAGAALIAATGIYAVVREARLSRRAARAAQPPAPG